MQEKKNLNKQKEIEEFHELIINESDKMKILFENM